MQVGFNPVPPEGRDYEKDEIGEVEFYVDDEEERPGVEVTVTSGDGSVLTVSLPLEEAAKMLACLEFAVAVARRQHDRADRKKAGGTYPPYKMN
jgi:hypothetical protein